MPTLEDQITLELEMLNYGIERYHQTRNRMIERGAESNTKYGRAMVASSIDAVAELVKDIQTCATSNRDTAQKKLKSMNAFEVSYITLCCMVDSLAKRMPLLNMAQHVGSNIEMQDRIDRWLEADPYVARKIVKQSAEKTTFDHARKGLVHKMNKDGYEHFAWTDAERSRVGVRVIDAVVRGTGMFKVSKLQTSKTKTTTYIEATEETLEWIRAFNEQSETSLPRYAPSIIEPKPWTDVWGGGFHSEHINMLPIVRAH